jgi:hypothetical protein
MPESIMHQINEKLDNELPHCYYDPRTNTHGYTTLKEV